MDGPVPQGAFWGKLAPKHLRPVASWLPLADHCCDVAMVCEALLTRTLLGRRLARLAGAEQLDPATVARLCLFAALHDLGKFSHTFQDKATGDGPGTRAGHVGPGAEFLRCLDLLAPPFVLGGLDAVMGPDEELPAAQALLLASVSHHGDPVPLGAPRGQWQARDGRDPMAGMRDLVDRCRRWFPEAFAPQPPPLPEAAAFHHAFAGIVMCADWLGSHTGFFPFERPGTDEDGKIARARAARAVAATGIDASGLRRQGLSPWQQLLPAGAEPRSLQSQASKLAVDAQDAVEIFEAETGAGKTEAALVRFARLFESGEVDGLYFALPTRTAATQIHARIEAAARKLWPDGGVEVVLAVPGYLQAGAHHGQRLPGYEVLWPDAPDAETKARRWAAEHPKRYLCATIAVGTIDQVLLCALETGHAHLRATALLRQLLVVDEVHASDAYMNTILRRVLQFHTQAGGRALLLSATLGEGMRAGLLSPRRRTPPRPLADAIRVAYPAVHVGGAVQPVAADGRSKTVHMEPLAALEQPHVVAALAAQAARAGARVLVVRNRVADAIATQEALEQELADARELLFSVNGIPAPHHSRFAAADRRALDAAIEQAFGKQPRSAGGCVAVATQTVQQSLDLDADLLVSDICPVDVLLQRIGRLHRHDRARPEGFAAARCVVLVPDTPDLGTTMDNRGQVRRPIAGLGSVYPDLRMVQATLELVQTHTSWHIPAMNRLLVEHGTHPEALAAVDRRSPEWQAHGQRNVGARLAAQGQATVVMWQPDQDFLDCQFGGRELDQAIKTRLGAEDRVIELETPVTSPFGHLVGQLHVPGWLCRGLPDDVKAVVDNQHKPGVWSLQLGSLSLRYDRWGLRPPQPHGDSEALDG